jgi:hypothetical protein
MNNLPHAPGPWRISSRAGRTYVVSDMKDPRSSKEETVICQVSVMTKGCNNLDLLVAAPDMLAALERIATESNKCGLMWVDKDSPQFNLSEAINDAIDVICKARGG